MTTVNKSSSQGWLKDIERVKISDLYVRIKNERRVKKGGKGREELSCWWLECIYGLLCPEKKKTRVVRWHCRGCLDFSPSVKSV